MLERYKFSVLFQKYEGERWTNDQRRNVKK